MSGIDQALGRTAVFRKLDLAVLRSAAGAWERRAVRSGQVLWRDGTEATELAVVESGELVVETWEKEVGRIRTGQLVGEGAAFTPGEPRTATVRADGEASLLVLSTDALGKLRSEGSPMYDFLLDRALQSLAERVGETGSRIARLSAGHEAAPTRKEANAGAFKSLWTRARAMAGGGAPPVTEALLFLPGMDKATPSVVQAISEAMAPRLVPAGQALFLEGDEGSSVYLVADGVVDVLRNTGRGRAEKLAGLHTGSLFGTGALLLGRRRNASCVAHDEAWIYELDRSAHDKLSGEAGRVWREVLMAALGFQIRKADGMIARLQGQADARSEEDFKVLNQAAGTLAAYTIEDADEDDESVEDPPSDNDDFLDG